MLIDTRIVIDGLDITSLIAAGGVKWSRNDVDGPNAGRNILGTMIRDRVATKIRLDIKCRLLESAEHTQLLNAIEPVSVTVTYDDPLYGTVSKSMYANNHSSSFMVKHSNGKEYWECSFPLIEI